MRPVPNALALLAPAAVALALVAASAWLAEPRVGYLAVSVVATAIGAITLVRFGVAAGRVALALAIASLAISGVIGGRAQFRLNRFSRAPSAVGIAEAAEQRERLRRRLDEEMRELRIIAREGRTLPLDAGDAMRALRSAIGDEEHRAVFVQRNDSLVAWAGTLHADPAQFQNPSGIVATPFGLTVYVSDDSATVRTVAASLLHVLSPADRHTRGLAQRISSGEVSEGFTFDPPSDSAPGDALRYVDAGRPLFTARALIPSQEEVRYRLQERARVRVGVAVLLALLAFLIAVARRGGGAVSVLGGAVVVLACVAIIPLSDFSTRSRLFSPLVYFLGAGRALTGNAAALALTSATALFVVLLSVRRVGERVARPVAITTAVVTIIAGPFAVRALAGGIAPPAMGAEGTLWLIWTIPLCLAATALLALASWAGRKSLGGRRGVPIGTGPAVAAVAALIAPLVWLAPGQWPSWYTFVWALAVAGIVLARPSRRALLACATVAALGTTTVVWAGATRGRMVWAETDVRGLTEPDASAVTYLERLAARMQDKDLPRSAWALLEHYVASELASAGFPVALISWTGTDPVALFRTAPFDVAFDTAGMAAAIAQREGRLVSLTSRTGVYGVRVIAVPMRGGAATIMVAPKTRLIGNDPYARWFGLAASASNEPPYTVQVGSDSLSARDAISWRRDSTSLHGDWPVNGPLGPARAHVEVDLRGLGTLVPRGGLLVLADLGAVGVVWLLVALADGRFGRWVRLRRRRIRSYRTRLSVALFLFFLVPASAFAVWSWQQLFDDAEASRRLLVTETMRAFTGDATSDASLTMEARRLDTKLIVYRGGVLSGTSDPLFADLAPMGRLMRPGVALELSSAEERSATKPEPLEGATGMLGYRVISGTRGALVLSAPARVDDLTLDRRRRDLGVLVAFATALGAAAAFWLSAVAARQLARPISALREAARAVARGESELPLDASAMSEFLPVFTAFRAMAHDLGESRTALVEAQRRTDAVLRTVASGVIAVDEGGRVILANPRAEALLGAVPASGDAVTTLGAPAVVARVASFLRSATEADGFEVERDGRTLRGQLTRLRPGGAVLTLDDVTELARAQRVLAWGEMARQVAHEIKNPLTPIRLGVQHLRRAFGRPDYEAVLDQNVSRILTEIDRLDEIARAFSRYGSAPEERSPAVRTDVANIVEDVVALEKLGEIDGKVTWRCVVNGEVPAALARGDELREVLLNLFENARLANAHSVTATVWHASHEHAGSRVRIDVTDDGGGIAAEVLPKIFEPHFSTRTSGSGLGLAITRRLVESWGGEVSITSEAGVGTTVTVELVPD